MVLETIDTVKGEEFAANLPKDPCSPLSVSTSGGETLKHTVASPTAEESRDAAVATPCDSIRMYADDLAPSKSGMSSGGRTPRTPSPCESIQNYANELTKSRSRSINGASAAKVPVVLEQREEAEETDAAVPPSDVPAGDPLARTTSVRSELSTSQASATRATLITVSSSEERKVETDGTKQADGGELQITDSVEVVALQDDEAPAVDEDKSEVKTDEKSEDEPKDEPDDKPEDKPEEKPEDKSETVEGTQVEEETAAVGEEPIEETKLAEEETKPVEDIITADEGEVKEQAQTEQKDVEKEEEEPQPTTAADASTPSRKKFGLKLSRKPSISKPSMSLPTLPKKPTSPKARNITKGFSKPNLSKPPLPKPNLSKPQLSMRFPKASLGKKSKTKADSSAPASATSPEESKQEAIETIDLNDDVKKTEEPSSPPAVETKQSCSAFFVEQNNSMQVKEAELLETTKEENDDEASLPEVQVTPQVTELVMKAPEAEAAEVAAAAAAASVPEEEVSANMNIIEGLFNKVEDCLGDVTELCGPRSKFKKAGKAKDDVTVTDEVDPETSEKSGKSAAASGDDAKEATKTKTTPVLDTVLNDSAAQPHPYAELMTPLSIATERAQSFMGDIMENPSLKSIAESISSAAKQAEVALFPSKDGDKGKAASDAGAEQEGKTNEAAPDAGSSTKNAEQDKLDKAAEMAKKALDGTSDEDKEEVATTDEKASKSATASKSKLFGRTGKSQLKIFAYKQSAAPEDPQAENTPAGPASPSRKFSIKRGFSTRAKSSASKVAEGKSADETKKTPTSSPFRRFKNPVGLVNRKRSTSKTPKGKTPAETEAKAEAAIVLSEEVQEDLAESTSMNSQSLNEPQTSLTEETPAPQVKETPKAEEDKDTPKTEEDTLKAEDVTKQDEEPVIDEKSGANAVKPAALADEPTTEVSAPTEATEEPPKTETPAGEESKVQDMTSTQQPDLEEESKPVDEPKVEDKQSSWNDPRMRWRMGK